ncbi:MAG: Cilia- and flagella-associated protein 251 [Marteilia pararefringens]
MRIKVIGLKSSEPDNESYTVDYSKQFERECSDEPEKIHISLSNPIEFDAIEGTISTRRIMSIGKGETICIYSIDYNGKSCARIQYLNRYPFSIFEGSSNGKLWKIFLLNKDTMIMTIYGLKHVFKINLESVNEEASLSENLGVDTVRRISLCSNRTFIKSIDLDEKNLRIYVLDSDNTISEMDCDLNYLNILNVEDEENLSRIKLIYDKEPRLLVASECGKYLIYSFSTQNSQLIGNINSSEFKSFDIWQRYDGSVMSFLGTNCGKLYTIDEDDSTFIQIPGLELPVSEINNSAIWFVKILPSLNLLLCGRESGEICFVDLLEIRGIQKEENQFRLAQSAITSAELDDKTSILSLLISNLLPDLNFTSKQANGTLSVFLLDKTQFTVKGRLLGNFKMPNTESPLDATIFPRQCRFTHIMYRDDLDRLLVSLFSHSTLEIVDLEIQERPVGTLDANDDGNMHNFYISQVNSKTMRSYPRIVKSLVPYEESGVKYLAALEDLSKLVLYSLSSKESRRLIKLPNTDHLKEDEGFKHHLIQRDKLTVLLLGNRIYLSNRCLIGDPEQFVGQTVSSQNIIDIKFNKNSELMGITSDGKLLIFKISNKILLKDSDLEKQSNSFYQVIGGKNGEKVNLLEYLFIYYQCFEFKKKLSSEITIMNRIEIEKVPDAFRAIGIFLSPRDESCLLNELKYDGITLDEETPNIYATLEKITRCVANYSYSKLENQIISQYIK